MEDPNAEPQNTNIPGDAGTGGDGGGGQDTPSYLSTNDFEGFRNQITGELGKLSKGLEQFQEFQQRFQPQDKTQNEDREPNIEDYDGTAEGVKKYLSDLAKYNSKSFIKEWQTNQKKEQDELSAKAQRQASVQAHVKRMGDAMKRYPDFEQVTSNAQFSLPDGSNGTPDVLSDVLDSDHSADLQYHLSKNVGDLYALVNAYNESEKKGLRFLARLESRFEREANERNRMRKQAGGNPSEVFDDAESGGEGNEAHYAKLARESFGLKS